MSPFRVAWWGLTLLVAALYATMLWLGSLHLYAEPGHLPPFDMRFTGYGEAEARAYLQALLPEKVSYYAGPMRWLDTGFLLLLGLWIWVTLRELGAWYALVFAPVYVVADLFENALVAQMLQQGADGLSPGYVAWASTVTVVKFAALAVALIALGHAGLRRWGIL